MLNKKQQPRYKFIPASDGDADDVMQMCVPINAIKIMINKVILPYINKIYIRFFTFFGNHFDEEREKGLAKSN